MSGGVVLEARVVTGEGGGPDKTILNTPRFMGERGYPSVCVYLRPPGDKGFQAIEDRARRWQAPLEAVDDSGPFDLGVFGRLKAVCDRHRPSIWHGHDYKTNAMGLLLARQRPMTLVTTLHGWVKKTWKTPLYYAIDRRCIRRYAAVMAVSKDLFDAAGRCGVPDDRCFLVPNAVDTDEFSRRLSIDDAKMKRDVSPRRRVVGAVGRLSSEKGFDLLVDAVADLVAEGLDLELHIAGEGDARRDLERRIAARGVGRRVTLLGFQSDLSLFYQSLDVFVLSSLREGLPNALLEAMAFETPVLATRIAGVPDLVEDGVTGLLIDPGSKDQLVRRLRELLVDPPRRSSLADRARRLVERDFSFAARMDRMKDVYDLTLEREGRR
jgi:glycosyltransferase involved in cell wall biosynthesis